MGNENPASRPSCHSRGLQPHTRIERPTLEQPPATTEGRLHVAVACLLPIAVFTAAAIAFTWPLAITLTTHKLYLGSDPILIHAILEWERFALFNDITRFFDGNFYHLTSGSLFFGDLLLGALPIYIPAAFILGPAGGFNALYVSMFVLNATAMYVLLLRITGNRLTSLLGGAVFAFAPIQQLFIPNHQMLMAWWTPLMLWFLVGACQRHPTRNLAGATLALMLQFATSIYLGFFALWAFALFLLTALAWNRFSGGRAGALRALAIGCIPVSLVFIPVGLGYLQFYFTWEHSRSIDEVIDLSATLPSYFRSAYMRDWMDAGAPRAISHIQPYLISGISGLAFAVAGVTSLSRGPAYGTMVVFAAALVLTSFLFSLGPVFKWDAGPTDISLPYQFAYDNLPGLQALRATRRWVLASHLGLSLLAGVGLAWVWLVLERLGRWRMLLLVGLAAAVALDFDRPSIPNRAYPEETGLREALRTLPRDPAIVVPMHENPEVRSRYMAWSAESSALPLLNGYNGFVPPTQAHLEALVNGVNLSEASRVFASLHALGVRTVILDSKEMQQGAPEAWTSALTEVPGGDSRLDSDRFVILRLADEPTTPSLSSWDAIATALHLSNLRAGTEVTAPLNLMNTNPSPWLSPVDQGAYALEVRWAPAPTGVLHTQSARFHPPPVIPAMGAATVPLTLSVPDAPGTYRLQLMFDGIELTSLDVAVDSAAAASAPLAMDAQLRLLDVSRVVRSGESVRLVASATNLGSATWTGDVRLGYRWWFRGDSERPIDFDRSEGRLFVDLDQDSRWQAVAPGSAYTFSGSISTPEQVGRHTLVVGMVKEGVTWFAENLLDVHVVDPDATDIPSVVDQLGLDGDFISVSTGETYRIAAGRLRRANGIESSDGEPLVNRRVRLASVADIKKIQMSGGTRNP